MSFKTIIRFLDKYKKYFGLADYKIMVAEEFKELGDCLAEVESNVLEKELHICLSKDFNLKTKEQKESILLHELIHARVDVFNKEVQKLSEVQEEYMVNDFERGFKELRKIRR